MSTLLRYKSIDSLIDRTRTLFPAYKQGFYIYARPCIFDVVPCPTYFQTRPTFCQKKSAYDTCHGFLGNPIEPRYWSYRRLPVGEAHPSRRHYTHPQRMSLNISPRSRITRITPIHPVPPKPLDPPELSEPPLYLPNLLNLLYLSCLGLIEFPGKL
jgi:hypothetical protein